MADMPSRITIMSQNFSAAAMEFHRAQMAERGYRIAGRIEPAVFQILEGVERPKDLFEGAPMFTVTFVRADRADEPGEAA